ncbi:MAG: hypothetical protein FJ318_06310 [SAR202 cluster bacterium]|nr:hypothetical protein [SAR202 cluster bacterium]
MTTKASTAPIAKKLLIQPGHAVLVLNAPEGFGAKLHPLPDGVTLSTSANGLFDCVIAFVYNKADVDAVAVSVARACKPNGVLWLAYPKVSSKLNGDLSRDKGWEAIHAEGFHGVTLVSIDNFWSAMRFRSEVASAP